jgi:hypothetical protein
MAGEGSKPARPVGPDSAKPAALQPHAAAAMLGLRYEDGVAVLDRKSLLSSLGGTMGIIESSVPSFLFLLAWLVLHSTIMAIAAAVVPVVGFGIMRLIKRQSVMQVFSGAAVAGISVWMALRPGGTTTEYFLPGLLTNLAYFVALFGSALVRWPLVGLILGFVFQHGTSWRQNHIARSSYNAATLALSALFALRLCVEVPLFLTNSFEALAVVKLLLGIPLYALGLWTAWLLARKGISAATN